MDGVALDKRCVKIKKSLLEMSCPNHPAYKVAHFCRRKQCGFGFVCEACEELEHAPLRHFELDGIGIDNLMAVERFLGDLFGVGLHYEDKEVLWPNCSSEELKNAKKVFKQISDTMAKELQETDKLLERCQKEILSKLELRLNKFRRDIAEEITKAFKLELRPLEYIIYAMENIKKKRECALERLVTELEKSTVEQPIEEQFKPKSRSAASSNLKLDMPKCSQAVQGHLEGTYNYLDIDYMKDMRKVLGYFDKSQSKVVVDRDGLAQRINQDILHEIGHLIDKLTSCVKVDEVQQGLEGLILSKSYLDNLATNLYEAPTQPESLSTLTLDKRVRVGQGSPVTSICPFDEKFIVIGHQNGTLRVDVLLWPDV